MTGALVVMLLIWGAGFATVNVTGVDVPPPGAGLKTVIGIRAAVARSVFGILASNCELLIKVVERSAPFHRTTEPLTKPFPETFRTNPPPPTVAMLGESEPTDGTAFCACPTGPIRTMLSTPIRNVV